MKPIVSFVLTCCLITVPFLVVAQDAEDKVAIEECFNKYLQSKWEQRRELMTRDAWGRAAMSVLYVNRNAAEAEIKGLGLKDYKLPDLPPDYKTLPEKEAIEKAQRVCRLAYIELSSELGTERIVKLLEKIAETPKEPRTNLRLVNIKVLEDTDTATAECEVKGATVLVPMKFKKVDGAWRFDGNNEVLFFDRQRQ